MKTVINKKVLNILYITFFNFNLKPKIIRSNLIVFPTLHRKIVVGLSTHFYIQGCHKIWYPGKTWNFEQKSLKILKFKTNFNFEFTQKICHIIKKNLSSSNFFLIKMQI